MAGRTLDRDRPFATVHGGDFRHRYEQDGRYFDDAGNETVLENRGAAASTVGGGGTAVQVTRQTKKEGAASTAAPASPLAIAAAEHSNQLSAQLSG